MVSSPPEPDPTGAARRASLLRRCTFPPPGAAVTCAVSGGADSLALLALAAAAGCSVTAIHVDHGVRARGGDEAGVVAAAARTVGAGFRSVAVDIATGPNFEARARAARYAALPTDVCTGHTADDQAETILLNIMRGAGLDGLTGMSPGVRHPLLALRRRETVALCAALGWQPVHDPSNDDHRYRRNRVRAEVLPLVEQVSARDPVPLLVRLADLARDDLAVLDTLAGAIDPTDARAVAAAEPALARRAVRRWLSGSYPPDAATVERVLAVARGTCVACEVGGGRRVERHAQQLFLHEIAHEGVV